LRGSNVTTAVRFVEAPTGKLGVGVWERAILRAAWLMVTVALTVWVGSAVDAAVMVTVPSTGTVSGAVYTVKAPIIPLVWAGTIVPHALVLPQVRVKSAPALEESFETIATKVAVAPVNMDAGGASLKPTEIVGVGVT
jgi:hypothetical protein